MTGKTYVRYLVAKITIQVDAEKPDEILDDILESVAENLDYDISFNDTVETSYDGVNFFQAHAQITQTEILELLDHHPD